MEKNYSIPEGAGKTLIPPIYSYCEHCHSYEWADWFDMNRHQFVVCRTCRQMSERDWYFLNMVMQNGK